MRHVYQLIGMTCASCETKVKSSLLTLSEVTQVEVSKETNRVVISMDKHIALTDLQKSLGGANSKYKISAAQNSETIELVKSWFESYKPLLLILAYITILTALIQIPFTQFNYMQWMRHFMAGFFLVFSFFKLLNLKGFAESYAMYDIVAKQWNGFGYVYAFIELALGISYLINFNPFITNTVTLIVMAISIIGVLKSVINKQKIQCACLGTVFNLPMSTVTVIEDGLMIAMSAFMLIKMK